MVLHYNIGSLFSFFRFSLLLCVTVHSIVHFVFVWCQSLLFFSRFPYCLFKASHLQHSLNFKVTIYSRFNGRFLVWWMLHSEITRNLLHVINLVSKMVFLLLLFLLYLSSTHSFFLFSLYWYSIHYFFFSWFLSFYYVQHVHLYIIA